MKTALSRLFLAGLLLAGSSAVHAWWNYNPWPVWTPMYWADEVMDEFDDDDGWYGPYGHPGYGYGHPGYGYPGGYGYPRYGYPGAGYAYPGYGYGYPGYGFPFRRW